jgi:4-hydroxybutyrate CoA-transferase
MNWQTEYKSKLRSPADAVSLIKPGDRVVIAHACGESPVLSDAMVDNAAAYKNIEVVHMVAMGKARYCEPQYDGVFRHHGLFLGGATRKAVEEGRADFTPVYFHQIPDLFRETLHPNVLLAECSPPDEHGYVSFGISVDYTKPVAEVADTVILQVNRNMPRTLGNSFFHIKDVDCFVELDDPVLPLPRPKITDIEKAIGQNVASLVRDGDTLQLGIGALPDAVALFLTDKKHLGIHSELVSEGALDLIEQGVIDCSKKTLRPGCLVATFLMGTERLYKWANNNPFLYMDTVDYVNNPAVIAQNDNMVAINSCVEVDLQGQVAAESVGLRQISAVGGQVDFIRGANMSRGGRAIIAVPSTAGGGKVSKIVPFLNQGAAVTTSRCDVNYVVTEYGIAQLKGKTLRQRARELIGVAHPDFRASLAEEFERRFHESL